MRRFLPTCLVAVLTVGAVVAVARPADAAPDVKVLTYSVKGKGNLSSLEAFASAAAATYADARGWSLGGSLRFQRVADGGDFTLWLAADALMPTFGGACDVIWSCRNGRHVVINEDRWLGATDAWNEVGAPLAAYRQMVLNHETGHWLGFGHGSCSGAGRPAPVMQQQSMSLAACTPNPWPLPAERAALAARRGVAVVQPGQQPPATSGTGSTSSTSTPMTSTTRIRLPVVTTSTTRPLAGTTTSTRPAAIGGPSTGPRPGRAPAAGACLVHVITVALQPATPCPLT